MARSARRKNYRKLDGLVFGLEIFVDYQETRTPRKLEHFGELFCKPGKLERSSFPGKDCNGILEIRAQTEFYNGKLMARKKIVQKRISLTCP